MLCLWFFYSFVTCILEQLWKWRDNSGDHEDVAEKFFNQSRSKWPKSMKCRWYSKYSSHSSTQLQHHFWRVIIFFDGSKKQLLVSGYWNTALLLLLPPNHSKFSCFKLLLIFGNNSQMQSNSKSFKTSISLPASWTGELSHKEVPQI